MSRSASPDASSAEPTEPARRPAGPAQEPAPKSARESAEPAEDSALEPAGPAQEPAWEPAGPALGPAPSRSGPAPSRRPVGQPASAEGGTPTVLSARDPSRCPWESIPVPDGYTLDASGVQASNGTRITGGPVWVKAVHIDTYSREHGLVIELRDAFGAHREIAVSRGDLHVHGSPLVARLARAGLVVVHGAERPLLKYLSEFDVNGLPLWQAVSRVGWIDNDDSSLAYMLPPPQGLLAIDQHVPVTFQPERDSPSKVSVYSRGTLEDWNEHVISRCKHNPLLLFPVLVGLSGPLLRFAELESGGFHYYGRSSHGKTTAAQAAASVWGNGADPAEAPDRAFVQKWNASANAFEALLCAHNDGLLVLDEIHTCDAKDFGSVIYNMASGRGKQALSRERELRPTRKWRTIYFSTGEVSVLSKLEADGKTAHAGQMVRLIDIPIEGGIIIETGSADPAEYADRLKAACSRYFGTAGPALIRGLMAEYSNVGQLVGTMKAKIEDHANSLAAKDGPPEVRRVVKRFALALTAGELGIKLGILKCEMRQVEAAVRTALRAWITDSAKLPDRLRGVMNVAEFIQRHAARFQALSEASQTPPPRDRAGYRRYDTAARSEVYMFTSGGFREACGGLDPQETAAELKRLRLLIAREPGRYTEKRKAGSERARFYVVRAELLEFDPGALSATPHEG